MPLQNPRQKQKKKKLTDKLLKDSTNSKELPSLHDSHEESLTDFITNAMCSEIDPVVHDIQIFI